MKKSAENAGIDREQSPPLCGNGGARGLYGENNIDNKSVGKNRKSWMQLRELKIKVIQLKDATIEYFVEFYRPYIFLRKYEMAFLVYEGDSFFTLISYYEIREFSTQGELDYYFQQESFHGWKKDIDEEVQEIFDKYPKIRLILAERPNKDLKRCRVICEYPITDKEERCETIVSLRDALRAKGVKAYYVKVPGEGEVAQHEPFPYCFSDAFLWTRDMEDMVREALPLITLKKYEESKGWIKRKKWIKSAGNGLRKIYFLGPCIVNGDEVFTEDELAVLLAELLENEGLQYEVIKICRPWFQYDAFKEEILACEIGKNDMVIFLDEAMEEYDFDLTKTFRNYSGKDWLYLDVPIHTTRRGNALIASFLMKQIILPEYKKSCLDDDEVVLQHGARLLSSREREGINEYLKEMDSLIARPPVQDHIAAIVMTGNPFTYGHQHLIEWGSKHSSLLYVFVVEEDAFLFSFKERIELIKAGTKHLDNVMVLPGGKFLATKNTFRNYYEREKTDEREIDASKDIFFFSQYVAPHLHIEKRFVGQEPLDKVTAQYNRQLGEKLPRYGIALKEIPRKQYGDQVISASLVRKCILAERWDRMRDLVPETTYLHIQKHIEELKMKLTDKPNTQMTGKGIQILKAIETFIDMHENVVLYGIGVNAQKIAELLGNPYRKKVMFCDRRAERERFCFYGKKVMGPEELFRTYRDVHVLITTYVYRREVYVALRNKGVPKENIRCVEHWSKLYE